MENLKSEIRGLAKKSMFLNKETLEKIISMIDNFSESELKNILDLLKKSYEKTIEHLEKELQKNPKLFEQAKAFALHKKENLTHTKELEEIKELDQLLATI